MIRTVGIDLGSRTRKIVVLDDGGIVAHRSSTPARCSTASAAPGPQRSPHRRRLRPSSLRGASATARAGSRLRPRRRAPRATAAWSSTSADGTRRSSWSPRRLRRLLGGSAQRHRARGSWPPPSTSPSSSSAEALLADRPARVNSMCTVSASRVLSSSPPARTAAYRAGPAPAVVERVAAWSTQRRRGFARGRGRGEDPCVAHALATASTPPRDPPGHVVSALGTALIARSRLEVPRPASTRSTKSWCRYPRLRAPGAERQPPRLRPLVEAHFTGHSGRPAAHRRGNSRPGS